MTPLEPFVDPQCQQSSRNRLQERKCSLESPERFGYLGSSVVPKLAPSGFVPCSAWNYAAIWRWNKSRRSPQTKPDPSLAPSFTQRRMPTAAYYRLFPFPVLFRSRILPLCLGDMRPHICEGLIFHNSVGLCVPFFSLIRKGGLSEIFSTTLPFVWRTFEWTRTLCLGLMAK